MTLRKRVTNAAKRLQQAGIHNAEALADAELLARHVLDWDRSSTYFAATNHPPQNLMLLTKQLLNVVPQENRLVNHAAKRILGLGFFRKTGRINSPT
ncbi:MAG: hypothetical protein Ct9H300mP25_10840 [Acidobacteriota bacterium]|nr:MAG: hypothetical protein Ct9H300mP25_10840 [Acidobacteriota bacterium]